MKKFFALFLALCLSLTCFAALAEEGDGEAINEIESTVEFEGAAVPVGELGLTVTLPSDWNVGETIEGTLGVYGNADMSLTIAVNTETDMNGIWEQCAAVEGATIGEVIVNGTYYILYQSADTLAQAAYTELEDGSVLILAFTYASAEIAAADSIAMQIIGSLAAAE